jgi:pimeloyl-ACP methyl ester carboxylesterase
MTLRSERVTVASSLGGMMAAEVAAHSPHRVERLALIAPMGLSNDEEDHGLRRRLYRLSMPTLLLWGSDDRIVPPRYADEFAAGIDHTKITLIAAAGHMVTVEKTKKVLDALSRYFDR